MRALKLVLVALAVAVGALAVLVALAVYFADRAEDRAVQDEWDALTTRVEEAVATMPPTQPDPLGEYVARVRRYLFQDPDQPFTGLVDRPMPWD